MKLLPTAALVAIAGCHSQHVVSPPKAEADVTFYGGVDPVTPGTALALMVTWTGWCEYVEGGRLDGENNDYPCNPQAFTVGIACEEDACTWKQDSDDGWHITPTKPGVMKARVTVTAKKDGRAKTYPLDPVTVVVPTVAIAACEISGDKAFVDVALHYGDGDGQIVDEPNATLAMKDGAPCDSMTGLKWLCPVDAPSTASFVVSAPSYTLSATAACVAPLQ
jgi:hypothetical protein